MKKLARLTALLLTGALLLVLTACGAVTETEQQAKQLPRKHPTCAAGGSKTAL